jgi:hypothetical protein
MHVVYICISVLMNSSTYLTFWLIQFCRSLQLLQSFFPNIALKGHLTQRRMAITVSILQKNFLTKCRPWATKKCHMCDILDLSLKLPKGRCMTFQGRCKNSQGRCKTISGEVRTSPGPPRGGQGGGGKLPRAPTLIGPQLESESLKLSRFFKLVRAFLTLRAPYSTFTCSLAKV